MSNNGQAQASSGLDMFKWLVALAVIVAAGVYGNNYYANDYSVFERTLALLVLAALALPVALTTEKGAAFLRAW